MLILVGPIQFFFSSSLCFLCFPFVFRIIFFRTSFMCFRWILFRWFLFYNWLRFVIGFVNFSQSSHGFDRRPFTNVRASLELGSRLIYVWISRMFLKFFFSRSLFQHNPTLRNVLTFLSAISLIHRVILILLTITREIFVVDHDCIFLRRRIPDILRLSEIEGS